MTVKRIWHGWTTPENADVYERLLHDEVFPGIEAKQIPRAAKASVASTAPTPNSQGLATVMW
ncbi:MAG: hypothetical protein JSW68_03585, partial [Burkholderiales bacterium]